MTRFGGSLYLALMLLVFVPFYAWADQPLHVPRDLDGTRIGKHMEILRDAQGNLSLQDVSRGQASGRFTPSKWAVPNFGFTKDAIWLRLAVINDEDRAVPFLLEATYPVLGRIELFIPRENGWERRLAGSSLPFHAREVAHRTFIFRLEAAPKSNVTYFLRVQTATSTDLEMLAWSPQAFFENSNHGLIALGLFFGIVLAMALFNFIVYLTTRDRSYLYSVVMIITFALHLLVLNGLAYQYLWSNWIWWANKSLPLIIAMALFWICQFARTFLDTARTLPRADFATRMLQWILVATIPLLFLAPYSVYIRIATALAIITVTTILVIGAVSLSSGNRTARFFLLAWIGMIVGTATFSLKTFGILPDVILTRWSSHIGFGMEVILISIALADRLVLMNRDLDSLNNHMESLVQERTVELAKTNRELLERTGELAITNQRLIDVNEQKNQFFGIVSHDLRNPLNGIVLATELLDGEEDLGEVSRVARQIRKEGMEMSALIGSFLDIAAIESGKVKAEPEIIDVSVIVQHIINRHLARAEEKGLQMDWAAPERACWAYADTTFTKEVLDNLISNAIKFSPTGTKITIRLEEKGEKTILAVADQGPGLTEEDRVRLFGRFARLSAQPTGGEKSTGLGLSIVKHMVEAMDGRIWVESEPGSGATFHVELPRGPVERETA